MKTTFVCIILLNVFHLTINGQSGSGKGRDFKNPGGVTGAVLWLKANDGPTHTGSSLDSWVDKAASPNTFTKTGSLSYTENSINFNPAVSIINAPDQTVIPPNRLDGNTSITYVDGFAVYRANSVKNCLVGGINPGSSYGVGIFLSDGNPEIGVGNGTSSSWAEFDNNNYTSYGIANLDISLGTTPYTTGRYNGITQTMSWKNGTPYSSITFTPMIGGTNNNGSSNGWYPFDGDVTEIILFPSALDATDKQKVESYLAIKYGITLGNNTSPVNYLSSAGTTIWTADAAFQYDVFGIGKDDASQLSQNSSNSYNTGSGTGAGQSGKGNIVVSSPSSFDDGDFLMIGHNNEPLTRHSTDLPAAYADRYRVKREWKAIQTNDPGTVNLSFDLTGLSVNGTQASDFFMLMDSDGDGDFSDATAFQASGFASNIATFSNVTFSATSVFTFITGQQPAGPAGVTGPSLWLKANDGASASGSDLTNWEDKANLNTFTEVGSVGYTADAINYNPVVTFTNNTGSGDNTVLPTNRLDGNVPVEYIDGFAVFKTNRQSSGPDNGHTYGTFYTIVGSTVKGSLYGAGIFAGDNEVGRVYSGNGTHEHYQFFVYPDYNNFNIANIDVSLSSDPFATGRLNGVNQTMAYDGANDFSSITVTPMIGGTNNDGNSNGFYALNGEVAEVVLYPKSLSNNDKAKVESYLALKYGISLGSNTDAVAYVSSAGTEIWAADATFKYDIFGIGKDDDSQLNQSISNSYNTGSGNGTGQSGKGNIVVSNPSSLADGGFLVIGHNNNSLSPSTADLPPAYSAYQRVSREWKAQKTGTVGTVSISFDMNGIQYTSTQSNQFFLLVDANGDGDFSDATATAATSYSGGVATFTGISFTSATTLFTFVTGPELKGPGGIKGPSLWLKANDGANTSGANLTGWTDKASVNNTLTSIGNVNYTTNALNFNPGVSINNSGGLPASLPANRLDGNYSVEFIDGFAVYQSNANMYTLVGSTVAGANYGPGIFMGDSESNPRVYAGNGTSSTYQYFNLTNLSQYNISNLDVSLATDPFATGRLNGLSKTMHNGGGSDYSSITITPMIGGTNNKGNTSGFYPFDGLVSEIVLFPKSLTENEKIKVESYLALKYGITLDISVANYLSSSGTAIWNNTTHWNDVFGIGKDDDSGLNQTSSNSYNTGNGDGTGQSGKGNIVISNPTSLDNGDFLMIGRNNKALSYNTLDLPVSYQDYQRLQREWKVQLTGTVGTVDITFDLNGIS